MDIFSGGNKIGFRLDSLHIFHGFAWVKTDRVKHLPQFSSRKKELFVCYAVD